MLQNVTKCLTLLNPWYKTMFNFYVWISLGTPLCRAKKAKNRRRPKDQHYTIDTDTERTKTRTQTQTLADTDKSTDTDTDIDTCHRRKHKHRQTQTQTQRLADVDTDKNADIDTDTDTNTKHRHRSVGATKHTYPPPNYRSSTLHHTATNFSLAACALTVSTQIACFPAAIFRLPL